MITLLLAAALAALVLYISYRYAIRTPEGLPPRLPRIPVFGSYLFLMWAGSGRWLHKGALWFSRIYQSDIISLNLGSVLTITAHSQEGIKEILTNQVFDGRPDIFIARIRDPNNKRKGIFFNDGPIWKEQRRFILRYMREFGFGRRFQELEVVISEEITDFIDMIKNGPKFDHEKRIARKGQLLVPHAFSPVTSNSIFHILFNERLPRADTGALIDIGINGLAFQRAADDYGKLLSIIPWIRYFFPERSSYTTLMESHYFIYKYFRSWIDKYIDTFDEDHERNFVDLYIKEMRKRHQEGREETSFLDDQFTLGLVDFSFPAFTAIGSQMSLLFQWLLLYPDVLKKVQTEIDGHVGSGRLPTLDDRRNLDFTEATVREILRLETLVPSDVPHRALHDTEFFGYRVPKGTIMIPSLYALHLDKRVWGDPEKFRPERFLDDNGKLCLKTDVSLPFGAGKRLCAGETFARNMLFLLTSAICQNFNIVLGPGEKLPDPSQNGSGLITTPPDFWVSFESR